MMVIKVDFDLAMSILAHNLYSLFAMDFERHEHMTSQTIYDKFIRNEGDITIDNQQVAVSLKKKRGLPLVLEKTKKFSDVQYPWLNSKKLIFMGLHILNFTYQDLP
jgi:hypothetical protein